MLMRIEMSGPPLNILDTGTCIEQAVARLDAYSAVPPLLRAD